MKNPLKAFLFVVIPLLIVCRLAAQEGEVNKADYGFQISELAIPEVAPDGYESVKTVALNKPLLPGSAYEVGFWIFGPQLRDQGYSFPIQIFPSNFMGAVGRKMFDLVEAADSMPTLEVNPPPSYTTKGHYSFVIRPDTLYNYVTVALKVDSWEKQPINIREDVMVTGVFVKPLPDRPKDETLDEITKKGQLVTTSEKNIRERKTERVLIDSKKSYTVTESAVAIGLYDHRNIDKDRVTIYLNDQIVIENYELKRKKKFFKAQLRPGSNTITLHAENLGEVAPNTAAIIIKSTSKEFMAVLESDLGGSQYFTLIYQLK